MGKNIRVKYRKERKLND